MKPSAPLKLFVIVCFLLTVSGCRVSNTAGLGGNKELDWILAAADVPTQTPGEVLAGSVKTIEQIKGDYHRVPADIRRTTKRLAWGLIKVIPNRFDKDQPLPQRVYAEVLVDHERIAVINVAPVGEDTLNVAVRVGLGGNADAQKLFINTLQKVLASKPAPVRDSSFKLPPS